MFKRGDKVDLTYYEFDGQVESDGWLVEDYDNGLMKATNEHLWEKAVLEKAGREPPKRDIVVFNLRSIGFLKAKLVE